MSSITETIVSQLETAMADASILFLRGKKNEERNAKKRRIVCIRETGQLSMSTVPNGKDPVTKSKVTFRRSERFRFVLHAESEETLDQMFDNFVISLWELYAPNVFEDVSEYAWKKEDADNGGATVSRQPVITALVTFRLMTNGKAKLCTIIEETELTQVLDRTDEEP